MNRDSSCKHPWRYRLALLAAGLLLLAGLQRMYVHSPVVRSISRLRDQISAAESAKRTRQRNESQLPKLEEELAHMKRAVRERMAAIAHVGDRPVLLAQLSQMAQAARLEILGFRPREGISREGYVELPVQLDLEGGFRDFVTFLRALAKIPHLSRLGNLTIANHAGAHESSLRRVSLEILTYALPDTMAGDERRMLHNFDAYTGITPIDTGESQSLRDPFQPPGGFPCDGARNSLAAFDLSELKLVGIIWENETPKGLVIDKASSGHVVTAGSRIGNRGGIVETITPTHMIVRENSSTGTSQSEIRALPVFTFGPTETENGSREESAPSGEEGAATLNSQPKNSQPKNCGFRISNFAKPQ